MNLAVRKKGNLPHTEQQILSPHSLVKDIEELRKILVSHEVE